ncbi:MAG: stability determinant [Comamonadaceae bacterium PBBC2]|nr:MAG: stability determinant [Comamonadaceae bacterium PBBC2]
MNAILSPLVSEFETEAQETSHVAWVKAKVQASLDDTRPGIPHDQVMAEMEAIIVEAENRHNAQK